MKVLDEQAADVGIKSVEMEIQGEFAYGIVILPWRPLRLCAYPESTTTMRPTSTPANFL